MRRGGGAVADLQRPGRGAVQQVPAARAPANSIISMRFEKQCSLHGQDSPACSPAKTWVPTPKLCAPGEQKALGREAGPAHRTRVWPPCAPQVQIKCCLP